MDVVRLEIPEVMLLRPSRISDSRGFFTETWSRAAMAAIGIDREFVQDNLSYSAKAGTLRGLHYQGPPHAQAKLVAAVTGSLLDVAVDIRRGSPTYGRHVTAIISADEGWQIYVPPGFLHGFVTLQDDTRTLYKVDDVWARDCEGAVMWNDPDLAIDWGVADPVTSAKDAVAAPFAQFQSPFVYGRENEAVR